MEGEVFIESEINFAYHSKMAPNRVARLVEDLRAWVRIHRVKKTLLARELEMSPQALSNLFSGRQQLTGEQTLAILELIRDKPPLRLQKGEPPAPAD